MAEADPRIEPVGDFLRDQMYLLARSDYLDDAYDADTASRAVLGEADLHDRLRALLANEGRATRLLAVAHANAFGPDCWDAMSGDAQEIAIIRAGHVLAALREVAGL